MTSVNFKLSDEELLYIEYLITDKYTLYHFIESIDRYYREQTFREKFNYYLSIYSKAYLYFGNKKITNYLNTWQEYLVNNDNFNINSDKNLKIRILYFLTDVVNHQSLEYISLIGDIWMGLIFIYSYNLPKEDKKLVYDFILKNFEDDLFQKELQHFVFQSFVEKNFLPTFKNNSSEEIYNQKLSIGYSSLLIILLDLWEIHRNNEIDPDYPTYENFYIRNIESRSSNIEIDFLFQLQESGLFHTFIESQDDQESDLDDVDSNNDSRTVSPIEEEEESIDESDFDMEYYISDSQDEMLEVIEEPEQDIVPSPLPLSDIEDKEIEVNIASKLFYMIITLIDNNFVSLMERLVYIKQEIEKRIKDININSPIDADRLGEIDINRLIKNLNIYYAKKELDVFKDTFQQICLLYQIDDVNRILEFINYSLKWVVLNQISKSSIQNTLSICIQTYSQTFKMIKSILNMDIAFMARSKILEIGTVLFKILDKEYFTNITLKSQLFILIYNQVLTGNKDLLNSEEDLKYCYSGILKLFLELDKTNYEMDRQITYEKDYHQYLIITYFAERINPKEKYYDTRIDNIAEWLFKNGRMMLFLISLTSHFNDKINNSLSSLESYKELKKNPNNSTFKEIYQYCAFNFKYFENVGLILSIISQKYTHLIQIDKLLSYLIPNIRYQLKNIIQKDSGLHASEQDLINYYPLKLYEYIADLLLIWIDHPQFYYQLIIDKYDINDNYLPTLVMILKSYSRYSDIRNGVDYLGALPQLYQDFLEQHPELVSKMKLPEEFLDPILCMPIENPVVIPETNGLIMDLSSIEQQIETLGFNPYTRQKLTLEYLKEFNQLPENKKIIENFLKKMKEYIT